jgi:hypothetical protein
VGPEYSRDVTTVRNARTDARLGTRYRRDTLDSREQSAPGRVPEPWPYRGTAEHWHGAGLRREHQQPIGERHVDFRIDKAFNFGGKYTATVMADVYNLFNSNAETNFILNTGSDYRNIIEWIGGRTLKIGLRFQF